MEGGFDVLVQSLAERITRSGGEVRVDSPVEGIVIENGVCRGVRARGSFVRAGNVVVTVPTPAFLQIARELPDGYRARLGSITYQACVCLVLQLNQSLSEFYWISVADPNSPFAAVIEHTNLTGPKPYGGRHIVYLPAYVSPESSLYQASDAEVYRSFLSHLQRIFPMLTPDRVLGHHVFRDAHSQPVFTTRFSDLKPPHETPIQNLLLATSAQVYPESRCVNTCVAMADEVAGGSICQKVTRS